MHMGRSHWDWSAGPITFDFSMPSGAYRYAAGPHHTHDPLNSQLVAWESLTRYDRTVNEQSLRNLMEQATRLVEYHLIFDTRKDGNILDPPHTRNVSSLHHLRSLCVLAAACLEHIQSPGLQELVVDRNMDYPEGGNRYHRLSDALSVYPPSTFPFQVWGDVGPFTGDSRLDGAYNRMRQQRGLPQFNRHLSG
jgi:hypothetical protein